MKEREKKGRKKKSKINNKKRTENKEKKQTRNTRQNENHEKGDTRKQKRMKRGIGREGEGARAAASGRAISRERSVNTRDKSAVPPNPQ